MPARSSTFLPGDRVTVAPGGLGLNPPGRVHVVKSVDSLDGATLITLTSGPRVHPSWLTRVKGGSK